MNYCLLFLCFISQGRDATPYLERNRVGRDAIDSAAALTDMGKYLFRERRLPVYDIAVAITKSVETLNTITNISRNKPFASMEFKQFFFSVYSFVYCTKHFIGTTCVVEEKAVAAPKEPLVILSIIILNCVYILKTKNGYY